MSKSIEFLYKIELKYCQIWISEAFPQYQIEHVN